VHTKLGSTEGWRHVQVELHVELDGGVREESLRSAQWRCWAEFHVLLDGGIQEESLVLVQLDGGTPGDQTMQG
jgi:hypothetical protein